MLGGSSASHKKSGKRQKDSNLVSESESKPRKKDRRDVNNINQQNVSYKSIPESTESMDTSSFYDTTPMDSRAYNMPSQVSTEMLAENVIEVEVDFNKKPSEELDATGIPKVLEAEFALRNTNGGVIQLKMKSGLAQNVAGKKLDQWKISLNAKRQDRLKELGIKEKIAEILDFRLEDLLIYVRKSSIILTEESNLLERRETEKHTLQSYFEIHNMLEKNNETLRCCCKDAPEKEHFAFGRQMSIGESVTVEYKHLTSKKLPDKLRSEVKEYIVQFANTSGGFVYFGIADDGIIKGQKISGEEKRAICHKLHACMESKIWVSKTGDRDTPVRGSHYQVNFFSVYGADETTFVIEVHICQYAGTVFLKEPVCMTVNEDNKLVKMDFKKWLSTFLTSTTLTISNREYRNRFERRVRGRSAYFSVKETVEKFVYDLKSALPGHLKVHPFHAMNWIHHQTLNMFVELIKKKFKENSFRGVAYIERCWEVNLGLPCTKPADVICDLLLCSPQMPLVLVSLTSDIPNEITSMYNKKVAKKLKATLVQEAGCLEKFYVKPITISHQWLESAENVSSIYSDMPEYPDTYRMSEVKYTKILEALVLVLARANVMATHLIGQGLFNLLTYEQYNILHEFYEESHKVKITGPPGSGKTVLALERMDRLRKSGCSYDEVFFLCSYKPLKARVENMTMPHDGDPLCTVMTYYEFKGLIESDENFHHALGNVKHILADEVQNFQADSQEISLDWWSKLNGMCDDMEDSSFWVFFDLSQKVNNKRSVNLRGFSQKNLKTVIRTTGEIHRFITGQRYMSVGTDVKLGHDLEGEKVEVLVPLESFLVKKSKHLVYILIFQLHKLIVVDGYNENRITVLFTSKADKDKYQKLFLEQTSNCSVRNGEEFSKSGVVFDTIRRYSGEENDIVIGFCPDYYTSGAQNNNALMVSLCSRAKLKLILIFENEEVALSFKLKGCKKVKYGNLNAVNNFKL